VIKAITELRGEHWLLSNFSAVPVTVLGGTWPSAEHAFQACKSADPVYRGFVALAETPGAAKKLGRSVKLRDDWEQVKIPCMMAVLIAKFSQNDECRQLLVSTGDQVITEGNYWHDQFWGDCRCNGERCSVPGQNVLGWLLMTVRAIIR
jgi:ribA/ribD-fused uncharacterized protein